MLPLFALTYTAARLGLEAQSAAAFRRFRLGRKYHQGRRGERPRALRSARRYCSSFGSGPAEKTLRRKKVHKIDAPLRTA
jgi:hypothetical protein